MRKTWIALALLAIALLFYGPSLTGAQPEPSEAEEAAPAQTSEPVPAGEEAGEVVGGHGADEEHDADAGHTSPVDRKSVV